MRHLKSLAFLMAAAVMSASCSTIYYDTLENFGIEKRDVLADRVEDGQRAQTQAQETFVDALERYRSVVAVDGGDLERTYDKLSASYDRMSSEADRVRGRIDEIEDVASALFREWERELDAYTDASLRRRSAAQLNDTKARYGQLISSMNRAAGQMDPVLAIFSDQVLFLKHNLNARAIASLDDETVEVERRVDALIREMDAAIREANAFIAHLDG